MAAGTPGGLADGLSHSWVTIGRPGTVLDAQRCVWGEVSPSPCLGGLLWYCIPLELQLECFFVCDGSRASEVMLRLWLALCPSSTLKINHHPGRTLHWSAKLYDISLHSRLL